MVAQKSGRAGSDAAEARCLSSNFSSRLLLFDGTYCVGVSTVYKGKRSSEIRRNLDVAGSDMRKLQCRLEEFRNGVKAANRL
ncbi:hypothetical protein AC578_6511 [Pseudocercospora eumusae]|uniref:Uncharacterized protein n=1 Tax=Pseudocercospora eumusae TaxID=321146 RepID=A0A139HHN1_9PEZI|nr:hypothetical protein AC578_6511 [Pseudocercospora eumusae]